MSACASRWFAGLTCDHLYADCPNRTRAEKTLRWCGWWDVGSSDPTNTVDPHATDICGLCVHRHNRSEHKKATDDEETAA